MKIYRLEEKVEKRGLGKGWNQVQFQGFKRGMNRVILQCFYRNKLDFISFFKFELFSLRFKFLEGRCYVWLGEF